MPRRTRKQLVGKQEDSEREDRDAELRDLEWQLHLAWALGDKKSGTNEVELGDEAVSQFQAKTLLLTVPA